MRELEQRFPNELLAIGVHSGKYIAERETERIRDAALRLDYHHPIVNDRQFRVWRSFAVRAWPTIVILGTDGRVLGMHAGEFTADQVAPFIERVIRDAGGAIDRAPFEVMREMPTIEPGTLRHPGKVALDGARCAVADSGHRRVLVGTLEDGGRRLRVERTVGGEGDDTFVNPQGMAFSDGGETLYVADPGAHLVRGIELGSGTVRTVAGTGRQLRTMADLENGALSSPWDLSLIGRTLFVAMAGIHQLWRIDLDTGATVAHSGSRAEDIVDGAHAAAALAQPMGIVESLDGARVYFADAESSAVRWADVDPEGALGTVVGTGLFDFGDTDGEGDAVRLQHPQGCAMAADGRLLVADSYNDALKWVDPATRRTTTWMRDFHEPGGVAIADDVAYVADTNAHRIVRIEVESGARSELTIETAR